MGIPLLRVQIRNWVASISLSTGEVGKELHLLTFGKKKLELENTYLRTGIKSDICKQNLYALLTEGLIRKVILSKLFKLLKNIQKCSPKKENFLLRENGFWNMVHRSWILQDSLQISWEATKRPTHTCCNLHVKCPTECASPPGKRLGFHKLKKAEKKQQ